MDQTDNDDSSLSKIQDCKSDIFVAATVIEDNAKNGERDREENNEIKSSSSSCQQEQRVSTDYVNINNRKQKDPALI